MSKFNSILQAAKGKEPELSPVKPKGRPKGKRSNPDYEQVTAYIKRETYRKTKIALLEQDEISDFSELVEELLTEWLNRFDDPSRSIL